MNIPVINKPTLYKLIKNGEVVYIGKSTKNIYARLSEHFYKKDFDEIQYKEFDTIEELENRERMEILRVKPKLNTRIENPEEVGLLSKAGVKRMFPKVDMRIIHNELHEIGSEYIHVRDCRYYNQADLEKIAHIIKEKALR